MRLKNYVKTYAGNCLCLLVYLLVSAHSLPAHKTAASAGTRDRFSAHELPAGYASSPGIPLPSSKFYTLLTAAYNDPIRFTLQSNKRSVNVGESFELTITADLLAISPNLMFFLPGSTRYRLKMLLPAGFEQTGGDFVDYTGAELSYPSQTSKTYHIVGRFVTVSPGTCFRLLRSHGQSDDQSLFVEKAIMCLKTARTDENPLAVYNPASRADDVATLYVLTDAAARGARLANADYRSSLDYANCNAVGGWVLNRNGMGQSVSLDVYVGGTKAATIMADLARQDVAVAYGSTGYNRYGYQWVIPEAYKNGSAMLISLKGEGDNATIGQTTTLTCAGSGPPATPAPTPEPTPTPAPTPPVVPTTPTGGNLALLEPTYDCATGAITFNTSGGNGTEIKFMSPGITDWTANRNAYLDQGSRVNADTPPFTLSARQSGVTVTYTWSRQATCSGTAPVTPTPTPAPTPAPTPTPTPTPPPMISTNGYYMYRGDTFPYQPLPATDSKADPFPVYETDKIKVTLALRNQLNDSGEPGMGGSVFQIYNKAKPGKTLVYNALVWNGEDQGAPRTGNPNRVFTGQGLSECLYQLPRPFYTLGERGQPAHEPSLGYNPNEVGDDAMNSGRLITYGRDGNKFYTEMLPMLYGQVQAPANEVRMRKWGEVKDRALILNYESLFNRASNERAVTKGQEAPCLYVNNMRHFKFYSGSNPYSNDGITTFSAPVSSIGNGNSATSTNGQRAGGQYVTEPWIGVFDDDGYGIALMLKDNIRSFIGYWGDGGGNAAQPTKSGSYGYIAHGMNEILDMNMRWRHRTEVIVGTVDEIRAYVYANAYRPAEKPSFKFNTAGREGWSYNSGDGDDRHTWDEPYTGQARQGWKVYFGASSNAQLTSPGVTWKASQFNKIYIRMAYTGAETQWSFRFRRNRQKGDGPLDYTGKHGGEEGSRYPDGTSDRSEQVKLFPVVGDGQFRTYEIDLSQNPEWRNIINEVYLKPHVPGKAGYQAGEYAIIDWIDASPSGPAN